jgi:hypothetical protein
VQRIFSPVRAPADAQVAKNEQYGTKWSPSYRDLLSHQLKKLAQRISEVTFGCAHRNIAFHGDNHQICMDCASTRLYMFAPRFGRHPYECLFEGCWRKPAEPQAASNSDPVPTPHNRRSADWAGTFGDYFHRPDDTDLTEYEQAQVDQAVADAWKAVQQ